MAPRHTGRAGKAEIPEAAWQVFLAAYLRPEKPTLSDCYRHVCTLATAKGWTVPTERTIARRIAEMPASITLAREGRDALERLYASWGKGAGLGRAE